MPAPSLSSISRPRSVGFGANRANPGRYWYANLMMGAHVLEQSRLHDVEKLVIAGTVCSYPKFTPVPFQGGRALERLPRGDERAIRCRQEGGADRGTGIPRPVRTAIGIPAPGQPLRAGRQLRPRDLARNPRPAIRKMVDSKSEVVLWGDGSPSREFLYVDDCVEGLVLAAEHYDGASQ